MNPFHSYHSRHSEWNDRSKVAEAFMEGAKEHKTPYEGFFWDALKHSTREGYLHQKIKEPRSYDYRRLKPWDDRSRMPQFQFTYARKGAKESADLHNARGAQEESEARQAVMTFVLGLTGESIAAPYRNQPSPDRMAEVKGRQVLDKYNCAGCHNVRPGEFEFRVTPEALKALTASKKLSEGEATPFPTDYYFPDHYIWRGRPPTSPD